MEMAHQISKRMDPDHPVTKALGESTLAGGGAIVPVEFANEIVEELGAQSVVLQFPVRTVPMKGSLIIPYIDSSATASWVGENSNVTASEPTFGQLQLVDHWLSVQVPVSNSFLRNNSTASDAFIRDHILRVAARKLDSDLIRGLGVSSAPQGLYGQAYTKFNANTTETLITVTNELTRAIREVMDENVVLDSGGWIFSPRTWGYLMSILNSNGYPAFKDEMKMGTLLGHPFKISSQIPDNLGSGTDESEIYFCNFSDEVFALNQDMTVEALNGAAYYNGSAVVSGYSQDQTVFKLMTACDFGSLLRGKNIAVIETVEWGS
jgi:HK97 family phage major capsid protein